MSTAGKEKDKTLWEIVTEREFDTSSPEVIFSNLKEKILKIDLLKKIDDKEHIISSYIPKVVDKEVIYMYGERLSIDKKKIYGDQIIKDIKNQFGEPDNLLTYDHVLISNMNDLNNHIILKGPLGSGKTHRIEYIWHKYLDMLNHQSCDNYNKCIKKRIRIRIDIDVKQNKDDVQSFYKMLTQQIYNRLEQNFDVPLLKELYNEFVSYFFSEMRERTEYYDYYKELKNKGGFNNLNPTSIEAMIETKCDKEILLLFTTVFCCWLRKNYFLKSYCIIIILDNIDTSSVKIQEAIIKLLTIIPICIQILVACREETAERIKKVQKKFKPNIFPHIGPTALEAILSRLKDFYDKYKDVNKNIRKHTELSNLLLNIEAEENNVVRADEFMENLNLLINKLEKDHFKRFFNRLFGSQIRQGLEFAQAIIDVAAINKKETIDKYVNVFSNYTFERILLLPWHLKVRTSHVPNIYKYSNKYEFRLGALRIITFIYSFNKPIKIRELYKHMEIFGYNEDDLIDILENMIEDRIVITITSEELKLESYEKCKNEAIKLSEIGVGLRSLSYELGYFETQILFALAKEKYHTKLPTDYPNVVMVFDGIKNSLSETSEIENLELDKVKKENKFDIYKKTYPRKRTITFSLYETIIPALIRIYFSVKRKEIKDKKEGKIYPELAYIIKDIIFDKFTKYIDKINDEYGLDPVPDKDYVQAESQFQESVDKDKAEYEEKEKLRKSK